jgi:hypothetical protein
LWWPHSNHPLGCVIFGTGIFVESLGGVDNEYLLRLHGGHNEVVGAGTLKLLLVSRLLSKVDHWFLVSLQGFRVLA